MARRPEFLPRGRQGQLDMCQQWLRVLPEQVKDETGTMVSKWKLWGVSEKKFNALMDIYGTALEALDNVKDKERNSDTADKEVKTAFEALVAAMRLMKRNYFHLDPLTKADLASLGLRAPDITHTISGDPFAQVIVETFLVGRHQLGIRLRFISGDPNDPANKGYRIHYKIVGHGEAAPLRPEDFSLAFPERRKLFTRDFDYEASGKTVYFCVQIENGKLVGPFGPITNAVIP